MESFGDKSNQRRIIGYDLLKALSLYLVILIHFVTLFWGRGGIILPKISVLATGATTTFFMINGYLLFSKPLNAKKHYKRTVQMAISLLIWRLIIYLALCGIRGTDVFSYNVTRMISYLLGTDFDGVVMGYSWFMYAMIAIWAVFPILKLCYDQPNGKKYISVLVVVLFASTCLSGSIDMINEAINRSSDTTNELSLGGLYKLNIFGDQGRWIISFMLGGLLPGIIGFLQRKLKKTGFLFFSLIGYILTWVSLYMVLEYQGSISGVVGFSLNDSFRLYTSVVFHSAFACLVFYQIKDLHPVFRKLIEVTGKNTLGIYYMHIVLVIYIQMNYGDLLSPYPTLAGLIIPAIIMLICLIITLILRKIPVINKLL